MKCFNLFKLVLWLFQSLAKLVILLYKRSRMLLYRAASYLTMTEATDPKKKKKKDDDDVNMYDDYEEDEEEDEDICGSGSSSSGDECYDDGSSSSSGSSGSSVCRQRRNKQQQQQRNNNNNSQQLQQNEGNTSKSVILRNIRAKKELVLDLDETLVHSTTEWAVSYHFTVTVKLPCDVLAGEADVLQTSEKQQQQQCFSQQRHEQEEQKPGEDLYPAVFYVTKRPHLDTFLKKVSKWYNLSVFTSSLRAYAEPVIDQIDNHHLIKKRFYRDVNK